MCTGQHAFVCIATPSQSSHYSGQHPATLLGADCQLSVLSRQMQSSQACQAHRRSIQCHHSCLLQDDKQISFNFIGSTPLAGTHTCHLPPACIHSCFSMCLPLAVCVPLHACLYSNLNLCKSSPKLVNTDRVYCTFAQRGCNSVWTV